MIQYNQMVEARKREEAIWLQNASFVPDLLNDNNCPSDKLLVYGFIRECDNIDIPGDIINYILLYAFLFDTTIDKWNFVGRVAAILGGTVCKHLNWGRQYILARKRLEGAMIMQAFFRGSYTRTRYLRRISMVKKGTKIVWIAYRRMEARRELEKGLEFKSMDWSDFYTKYGDKLLNHRRNYRLLVLGYMRQIAWNQYDLWIPKSIREYVLLYGFLNEKWGSDGKF